MKKHILFALFLSLATSICYSQVKINVQGGAGINGITKEEVYKANFGYRFGVGVEIPLVRTWSLQTGLQFLNRKSTADESVFGYTLYEGEEVALYQKVKSTINAVYLQLPVKIATCLPIGKKLRSANKCRTIHCIRHRRKYRWGCMARTALEQQRLSYTGKRFSCSHGVQI